MRFVILLAPLALLACSPAASPTAAAPPPEISPEARAAMDQVNSANFASLADVPAVPDSAVPASAQAAAAPAPDATAPAEPSQTEANVDANVRYNAALVRIEVALDRAHFSPGVIDGYDGENVRKAVSAYQAAHNMPVNGQADDALLQALVASDAAPALVAYTITADDVRGPFVAIPDGLEALSHLDHVGFARASEAIAEKFHMDEDLLRTLNPGADFTQAGGQIVVANAGSDLDAQVASIVVDKRERSVRAFDAAGQLLAFYPASIGSPDAPAPSGDYAVRAVAFDPTYHYDPARLPTFGRTGHGALTVAAGPNNPVGSVWIALTLDTYGIHGAPEADQVSKTQSHGCVRLTNWDATELGHAVRAGVPVSFRDAGLEAETRRSRG